MSFMKRAFPAGENAVMEESFSQFVDFEVINDATELVKECELFLSEAQSDIVSLPFNALSRIRNWRVKRRDSKLAGVYENLVPRIQNMERLLRNMIGDVVERKNALRIQARFLQMRLESCIDYNNVMLDRASKPLEELRTIVNKVTAESTSVKNMMAFYGEIMRLKNIESISNGRNFMTWSTRTAMIRSVSDAELMKDVDYQALNLQLSNLREVRELSLSLFSFVSLVCVYI